MRGRRFVITEGGRRGVMRGRREEGSDEGKEGGGV